MDDLFKRVLIAYPVMTAVFWLMKISMVSMGANLTKNPAWGLISSLSSLFSWGLVIAVSLYALIWTSSAVEAWIKEKMEARDKALKECMRLEIRELKNRFIECTDRINVLEHLQKQDQKDKLEKKYQEKVEQEKRDRSYEDSANSALDSFII